MTILASLYSDGDANPCNSSPEAASLLICYLDSWYLALPYTIGERTNIQILLAVKYIHPTLGDWEMSACWIWDPLVTQWQMWDRALVYYLASMGLFLAGSYGGIPDPVVPVWPLGAQRIRYFTVLEKSRHFLSVVGSYFRTCQYLLCIFTGVSLGPTSRGSSFCRWDLGLSTDSDVETEWGLGVLH